MSINFFNEIALSGDNSHDPGSVPLECLRHGVTVDGPYHLLDLQNQVLGFTLTYNSETPNSKQSKFLQ